MGSVVGWLFHEIIPMALPSLLMPSGYDYFERADPFTLFSSELFYHFLDASFILTLCLISVVIASKSKYRWLGLVPPIVWIIFSTIEVRLISTTSQGWLAPSFTMLSLFFVAYFSKINFGDFLQLRIRHIIVFIILVGSATYWFMGYDQINYLASVQSQAGVAYEREKKIDLALNHYQKAAQYAPKSAEAQLTLARILHHKGQSEKALHSVDNAIGNLGNISSWSSQFTILSGSTALMLEIRKRDEKDRMKLERLFKRAEQMWRENSRLPKKQLVSMLYNRACFESVYNKNNNLSSLYLLEAVMYDKQQRLNILSIESISTDLDIETLKILEQTDLSEQEYNTVRALKGSVNVPNLKEWIKNGELSNVIVLKLIKFLSGV